MDLNTVTSVRRASARADLAGLGPDTAVLAGGTWMYSDPQVHLRELVDVTGFGWPPLTVTDAGLEIAATCTLAELSRFGGSPEWTAVPLFRLCCTALVGSFKIWNVATVGGNICLALPAGPMTSLCAALDGVAVIWTPDGGERRVPVAEFVVGDRRTVLARRGAPGGAPSRRRAARPDRLPPGVALAGGAHGVAGDRPRGRHRVRADDHSRRGPAISVPLGEGAGRSRAGRGARLHPRLVRRPARRPRLACGGDEAARPQEIREELG